MAVPPLSVLLDGQQAMIPALPLNALTTTATPRDLLLDLPAAGPYTLAVGELANPGGATLPERTTRTRYEPATQPTVSFPNPPGESRASRSSSASA